MEFRAEKLVLKQNNLTMQGFKEAFHSCTLQGSPAIDKAVLKMKVKMFWSEKSTFPRNNLCFKSNSHLFFVFLLFLLTD